MSVIPGDTYGERAKAGTLSSRYDSTPVWMKQGTADQTNVVVKTTNYTATKVDDVIEMNASGGARTVTLPSAAGITGAHYTIKKIDSSGNTVTVQAAGSETIDGANTSIITAQYESITAASDGTGWVVI